MNKILTVLFVALCMTTVTTNSFGKYDQSDTETVTQKVPYPFAVIYYNTDDLSLLISEIEKQSYKKAIFLYPTHEYDVSKKHQLIQKLEQKNVQVVTEMVLSSNIQNHKNEIQELLSLGPDVIVFFGEGTLDEVKFFYKLKRGL